MRVAVLSGGRSSEHDVSLASGEAVRAGLVEAGHQVLSVQIGRDGVWRHDDHELRLAPGRGLLEADVAFPALHGPFGEDGCVQGVLETLGVAYVGSGVPASAVCMDKVLFKELMGAAGVPQVDYRAVDVVRWRADPGAVETDLDALGLPVFVKPARLGSSVGIAKVSRAIELGGALGQAFAHDPLVIVEAMAGPTEVECSVLGNPPLGGPLDGSAESARRPPRPQVSPPGEIVVAGEWYDYQAKYTPDGMALVVPARISEAARERVRALALDTFLRAGCAGLARVDFFVDGERVLVNELNTMPGFTATSVYAKLLEAGGVAYPEVVDRLCRLALERQAAEREFRF